MTQLMCLCLLALSTVAVGLHTKNIRGAGNHSLLFGLHEAQPESPEVAQEGLEAEQEDMLQPDPPMRIEGQINMTENDMDMLTDRTGNDLYDLPDSLTDITMADEPNPSAKGKTFLTADRIQKLIAQAEADMKVDKNLVKDSEGRGKSGLFMGYSKNRDLVIKTDQYQNMTRPIVDASGSYRILETEYDNFAGRDPNELEKDLRAIEERKAAEQKAAEQKAAEEKAAKEKANQTETANDDEEEAADDAEKETDEDAQEASEEEDAEEKKEDEEAEKNKKEATAKEGDAPEKEAQTETAIPYEEESADDTETETADDAQEASVEEASVEETDENTEGAIAEEEDAPEEEAQTETAVPSEDESADETGTETADDAQETSVEEASVEETDENTEGATAEEEDAPEEEAQTETAIPSEAESADDTETETADDAQSASVEEASVEETEENTDETRAEGGDAPEEEAADQRELIKLIKAETEDEEE